MKVAPAMVYRNQDSTFFITIPLSRDLDSYPNEVLDLFKDGIWESGPLSRKQFNDDEYELQLSLRIYTSAKAKKRVYVKYTVKKDDFGAIPKDVLAQLGTLTQISSSTRIGDLPRIQKILKEGYLIV